MGADTFVTISKGRNAKEAFSNAVKEAQYNYGHAGYTGTIAEKDSFVIIDDFIQDDPVDYAVYLINNDDERIDDKWGDAGCIKIDDETFVFFGWASS